MRIWRARVQQLRSGEDYVSNLALPREPASIVAVLQAAKRVPVSSGRRVWRLSLVANGGDWAMAAIGTTSRRLDNDEWDEGAGWRLAAKPTGRATEVIFDFRQRIVTARAATNVEGNPTKFFLKLQQLLNDALLAEYGGTGWIFALTPERDESGFFVRFDALSIIDRVAVSTHVPNADAHDPLQRLQGIAGEAGGETVEIVVASTRGIRRASEFIQTALTMLRAGLAKVQVWGRRIPALGPGEAVHIDSTRTGKDVVRDMELPGATLRVDDVALILALSGLPTEDRPTDPGGNGNRDAGSKAGA